MAAPLIECMEKKNNDLWPDFCGKEGVRTSEIYRTMAVQYEDNCMTQKKVYEWVERFKGEWKNVLGNHML
jgi:hypothetical protein